jgi:hypothetical protein
MTDYIEAMLEAKRLLKVAEDAAMKGDYDGAHRAVELMDVQLRIMLDWFADSLAK